MPVSYTHLDVYKRQDSAVYIFDEAASNIDVESEELIMNVIHELAKTKTVLLISHRPVSYTHLLEALKTAITNAQAGAAKEDATKAEVQAQVTALQKALDLSLIHI